MRWQDLLCASCGGRVAEARCATCRAARERFTAPAPLPAAALLAVALLICVLALLLR